ncbi:MAG: hypothetical protein DRH10_09770 [Deltaproteobacteria bacterium]|nr:MAG: hypothetical protein DRH10_09770 [Deltaproteobacteria bacterium]
MNIEVLEMSIEELAIVITSIATFFYASFLFFERITDKPKLKIEFVKLLKIGKDYGAICKVINTGRRVASNCEAHLKVLDIQNKTVRLFDIAKKEKNSIEMIWDWREDGDITISPPDGTTSPKILKVKDLYTQDINPFGGWSCLGINHPSLPPLYHFSKLQNNQKYKMIIKIFSGTTSASVEGVFLYPDDFENNKIIYYKLDTRSWMHQNLFRVLRIPHKIREGGKSENKNKGKGSK